MIKGKIVVFGSRSIISGAFIFEQLDSIKDKEFVFDELITGTAIGVDSIGESWALKNMINVTRMPADWKTFGISAGHRRNKQMADYCDAGIGFYDMKSRGTANMIELMKASGKPLLLINVSKLPLGFEVLNKTRFNRPVYNS